MNQLQTALNAMLRCYDYGNSTKPAEWHAAVALAREALKAKPTGRRHPRPSKE